MSSSLSDTTTHYEVTFTGTGPMGLDLESSDDGKDAYVVSTKDHKDKIKPGHVVVAVNNEPVEGLTFDEILEKFSKATHPRTISFSTKKRSEIESAETNLPLPDDFFNALEPLTDEDEKEIMDFMNAKLKEALALVYADPKEAGLDFVRESHGVTIHSKKIDGSPIRLVRAKTKVPIAADLFMYAALAPESSDFQRIFTMLDPMFKDGKVVYTVPKTWTRYLPGKAETAEHISLPLYSVKWAAYQLPYPLWSRDFVWAELTTWAPDGSGVSMAMSIPKFTAKIPSLEGSHRLIRGSVGMSGYIWKDLPGHDPKKPEGEGHMMCEITYLLQIDLGGVIPTWVMNLTGPEQGMNCLRVVKYAEEQRKLVKFMYDKNPELNRTEVRSHDIAQGEVIEIVVSIPAGKEFVYDWCLENHDIGFAITDPKGNFILPMNRESCNLSTNPYHGRFTANESGEYTLVFDNKHSWFTGKRLHIHYLALI